MFDSIHRHSYGGPSRIDMHEHKAPTDDSIRLYGELLEKARGEVMLSLSIDTPAGGFRVIRKTDPPFFDQSKTFVLFSLNGKPHQVEVSISSLERLSNRDKQKLISLWVDRLSRAIVQELMPEAISALSETP